MSIPDFLADSLDIKSQESAQIHKDLDRSDFLKDDFTNRFHVENHVENFFLYMIL